MFANFNKVVSPGFLPHPEGGLKPHIRVFVQIIHRDGRLSLTGVQGPLRGGAAVGSAGQIYPIEIPNAGGYSEGWDRVKLATLNTVWKDFHLNYMRAGCEHQRAAQWEKRLVQLESGLGDLAVRVLPSEHPGGLLSVPCPECGYEWGTSWLIEEVPEHILDWLAALPDAEGLPSSWKRA